MLKWMLALFIVTNFSFAADTNPVKADALRLWQKRDDRQSLQESLQKFEEVLKSEPQDLEVLTYLTRGYFLLADLHLDGKDEKKKNYEKAKEYGEKALATNSGYKDKKDKDIEKAIDALTEREVAVTYWTAAALGKWAKLNGVMSSLKYKDQILGMIEKVGKLKPHFFYGAVPRYWGGFYAIAPGIAGGSMRKSKKNFKKAIEEAPEYLGNRVLYAELYWTEEEDKKEFKKQLQLVLDAPLGPEEIRPENTLEKKKAEKLLGQVDKIFD